MWKLKDHTKEFKIDLQCEDRSLEATQGYILDILKERGACTVQFFREDATEVDDEEMLNALRTLVKDDTILRKGVVFYLPRTNWKELNGNN